LVVNTAHLALKITLINCEAMVAAGNAAMRSISSSIFRALQAREIEKPAGHRSQRLEAERVAKAAAELSSTDADRRTIAARWSCCPCRLDWFFNS